MCVGTDLALAKPGRGEGQGREGAKDLMIAAITEFSQLRVLANRF